MIFIEAQTNGRSLLPRVGEGGLQSKPDEGGEDAHTQCARGPGSPSASGEVARGPGRRDAVIPATDGMTLWQDGRPLGRHGRA